MIQHAQSDSLTNHIPILRALCLLINVHYVEHAMLSIHVFTRGDPIFMLGSIIIENGTHGNMLGNRKIINGIPVNMLGNIILEEGTPLKSF